ncbi:SigE family RNA polymerase sigma factor [Phytohabitans sp. ZYX-F-186]|uniref:SigE family RNA polymerase sigma factor n=1 Tax=Phytohabitans maris TaxID=3071409 RepID=A0ABU0ZPE2_9ACTN|nr:SigE family RNA polymerase sigma factor [Phytohabitans sp. ZYX-F-186]MDQ7908267.1 SigE family RNA polymerase sigma factor [Phytohabitans sp. ZYX-F-186]
MTEGPIARWSRARQRQRAAQDEEFTEFVAATAHGLRRTAFLLCGDWHLAQDLTQTALTRMYASWGRVRRSDNLNAYSRRVLMNALFDQRKRRSSGEVVVAELPESAVRPPQPAAEVHVTLMRALATLSLRDQAIVVLRYWEDQSVETVAEILDVSASVVKTRSARALTRLRALLGEEFVGT